MDRKQLKSLLRPEAYPEPVEEVVLLQTHVSWIFLAGEHAYKIKKPVDFGFLNFTTLDRRMFYCQEEVRLNRRLCPDVYLGVIPVREAGEGLSFCGDGAVVDHAVLMKRLPAGRMADRLLAQGSLGTMEMELIALRIAAFHRDAQRCDESDGYGSPEMVRRNWEENFSQVEEFAGITIEAGDLAYLKRRVHDFLAVNSGLISARLAGGFVRECDGDIHLENICLDGGVQIFDCIEFNKRFRFTDTAADIAFLLMDLEYHGRRDLAHHLLTVYLRESCDIDMLPLLGFYCANRAFIRGKVESLRLKDQSIPEGEKALARERAKRYFRLARGYFLRAGIPRAVVVLAGLSGSGKSTIADELSLLLGWEVLSSDRLRKELAGITPEQRPEEGYGCGLYGGEMNSRTYAEIVSRARQILAQGKGVILDATYRRSADRALVNRLAGESGVKLHGFFVCCPDQVVRERLEERLRRGGGLSDADWEVYLGQLKEMEPVADEPGWVVIDGARPAAETAALIVESLGFKE